MKAISTFAVKARACYEGRVCKKTALRHLQNTSRLKSRGSAKNVTGEALVFPTTMVSSASWDWISWSKFCWINPIRDVAGSRARERRPKAFSSCATHRCPSGRVGTLTAIRTAVGCSLGQYREEMTHVVMILSSRLNIRRGNALQAGKSRGTQQAPPTRGMLCLHAGSQLVFR